MKYHRITGTGQCGIQVQNVFICTKAVLITDGNPDLGIASEEGNNDFSSVTGASLTHEDSSAITAIENTLPHSPPQCGTNIVITGLGRFCL